MACQGRQTGRSSIDQCSGGNRPHLETTGKRKQAVILSNGTSAPLSDPAPFTQVTKSNKQTAPLENGLVLTDGPRGGGQSQIPGDRTQGPAIGEGREKIFGTWVWIDA